MLRVPFPLIVLLGLVLSGLLSAAGAAATPAAPPTGGTATLEYDIVTTQAPYPVLRFPDATTPWLGYVGTIWAGYDRAGGTLTLYLPDPTPPAPCPHDCYQGQISYRFIAVGVVEDVVMFDTTLPANLGDQGSILPTVQLKSPPRLVLQLPPQATLAR